ncbi:MAG: hypothetical protein M3374_03090, partial [Pseudomonadota bacterium]|nr:hypothetical protein [Pseudomonadota bacterium]
MSLPWTEEQREWLQALGHPVLVLAGDEAAENPQSTRETAPSRSRAPQRTAAEDPDRRRRGPGHVERGQPRPEANDPRQSSHGPGQPDQTDRHPAPSRPPAPAAQDR